MTIHIGNKESVNYDLMVTVFCAHINYFNKISILNK